MGMKKVLILILSVIYSLTCFAQSNVEELRNKRIIIPPLKKIQRGSFYTYDVLQKMKFEDKYEYNELLYGDTLRVLDVQHLNIGNKKNEKILIHLLHNGKKIILYMPLYINSEDKRLYRNFYSQTNRDAGLFSISEIVPYDNVLVYYYDVDEIDNINSLWQNCLIYPRETEFGYVFNKDSYETERLVKSEPYIFLGFTFFEDPKDNDTNFESLFAVLSNRQGIKHYLKIKPANRYISFWGSEKGYIEENAYGYTLSNLSNGFYTNKELIQHCETSSDIALVDSIKHNYVGKEVYIDKSLIEDNVSERAYNIASNGGLLNDWGDGYFIISKVEMRPSYSNKPFYKYFAIATNNGNSFAIPIDKNFHNAVIDADTHRAELEATAAQSERERLAREAQWARQEREEQATLARKYGNTNAKLIYEGSIRLGFTKAMVREAWGSPYDTMTVSNNYGTIECWIYGVGAYVYFSGNKVVQIIN